MGAAAHRGGNRRSSPLRNRKAELFRASGQIDGASGSNASAIAMTGGNGS